MRFTDSPSAGKPLGDRSRVGDRVRALLPAVAGAIFAVVAAWPVIRRYRHPSIFGDDIARLVDLIENPFRELMFLPFAEHVAPWFQFLSWLIWQIIGHDVRMAPLAYTIATCVPWLIVLVVFGIWLNRETGSRTATLLAIAVVAQCPLVLETVWWYSASSFLWAIAGILLGLLGASWVARSPWRGLALVAIGAAVAPAGTSLGNLAAPLAILRGLIEQGASRRLKVLVAVAAIGGLLSFEGFCRLGDIELIHAARMRNVGNLDVPRGLSYVLTTPGRILVPATLGVPASHAANPQPAWLCWGSGLLALSIMAALAFWPDVRRNRRLVLVGMAMIYCGYALIYPSRVFLMTSSRWTERQLLYDYTGRYHVLPLLGLAAIGAAVLSWWPVVRRLDNRRGLPALAGAILGLVFLGLQYKESNQWRWMLRQPGQKETLAVLQRLGEVAREEGVTRAQLLRIIAPAYRPWNQSLVIDRPGAFSLMHLVVLAPDRVARPLADDEARNRLVARLTHAERLILGAETCASIEPAHLEPDARVLSLARRVEIRGAREIESGRYQSTRMPASITYEFVPATQARYLVLPGLSADQDVVMLWLDGRNRWRSTQSVRWLHSPRADAPAVIDLERLIHRPESPLSRIEIQFTKSGEIALEASPRLLR